jgi:hypothetical protein
MIEVVLFGLLATLPDGGPSSDAGTHGGVDLRVEVAVRLGEIASVETLDGAWGEPCSVADSVEPGFGEVCRGQGPAIRCLAFEPSQKGAPFGEELFSINRETAIALICRSSLPARLAAERSALSDFFAAGGLDMRPVPLGSVRRSGGKRQAASPFRELRFQATAAGFAILYLLYAQNGDGPTGRQLAVLSNADDYAISVACAFPMDDNNREWALIVSREWQGSGFGGHEAELARFDSWNRAPQPTALKKPLPLGGARWGKAFSPKVPCQLRIAEVRPRAVKLVLDECKVHEEEFSSVSARQGWWCASDEGSPEAWTRCIPPPVAK